MAILEPPTLIPITITWDQSMYTMRDARKQLPQSRGVMVVISGLDDGAIDVSSDIVSLQIERFIGSEEAKVIWRDWLDILSFDQPQGDWNLQSGLPVNYRVRYKDILGSISEWSEWSRVTV